MPNSFVINGAVQFQAPQGSSIVSETLNLQTSLQPVGTTLVKTIAALTSSPAQQVLPNLGTPGPIILRNLDSSNSVTYGPNSASQAGLLIPGDLAIYRPNGGALWAGTVSGTAQLQIFATPT